MIDRLGATGVVGLALTVSSAIAFIGARLNSRDDSDIFFDNLDNEVDPTRERLGATRAGRAT